MKKKQPLVLLSKMKKNFKIIGVTDTTVRRILEKKNCDALSLYVAYYEISIWQGTHRVYATESFMMKRLNIGRTRFRKAKNVLEELNIIKLHNGGRGKKSYIEIFHLVDSSVESNLAKEHSSVDYSSAGYSSVENDPQVLSTLSKVLSSKSKVLSEDTSQDPINKAMPLFKPLNKTGYKRWFGNTTQRKAVKDLLEDFTPEQLEKKIAYIVENRYQDEPYQFPSITTPLQFQEKHQNVLSWEVARKKHLTSK